MKIGITDYFDAGLRPDLWQPWVDKLAGIILVTKAPHLIEELPPRSIIHCTITGYGGERMEPNVAPIDVTIPAYHRLVEKYGGERVVLRVDPIIPLSGLSFAYPVLLEARGRVRISFIDWYPHTRKRIRDAYNIDTFRHFPNFHIYKQDRMRYYRQINGILGGVFPEVCGEPDMPCTGCVSERDIAAMGLDCKLSGKCHQRDACACAAEKFEIPGPKMRCQHGCLYCFWKD